MRSDDVPAEAVIEMVQSGDVTRQERANEKSERKQMLIEKLEQQYGNIMTPKDVAKELHTHPTHIRKLCRDGKIPAVQFDGRWRIPTAKFAAILERANE